VNSSILSLSSEKASQSLSALGNPRHDRANPLTCSVMPSMFSTTSLQRMSEYPSIVRMTSVYRSYSWLRNSSSSSVFSSSGYSVTGSPNSSSPEA